MAAPSDVPEGGFDYLDAPVRRLAGRDMPIPYSKELERQVMPQEEDIVREARRLMGRLSRAA